MLKRILSLVLLMATGLALCACPGGGPVTPPAGEVCPDCGKEPCECPVGTPCPDCGKDPCECPVGTPCPDCGKDPCECPEEDENGVTVSPSKADLSIVFSEGATLAGTGDRLASDAPVLTKKTYDAAAAVPLHISRFFSQIVYDGGVYASEGLAATPLADKSSKTYGGGTLTTMVFDLGLEISGCTNVVFRNLIIVGDVTLKNCHDVYFENVQFDGRVTVGADCAGVEFDTCRLTSLENAGSATLLVGSAVAFEGLGIDNRGKGLYVENCRLEGTGTAISSTGDALEVRRCTLLTDQDGIGVEIRDCQNSLVALCVIRGAQKSVLLSDVFNTVAVRNSLVGVSTVGGKNVYICDNAMGGRIYSENNNYFIADGNTYPADGLDHRTVASGNENTNGNTLTDVNARLSAGANEAILPHINRDQFVGMERRATVKDPANPDLSVYAYVQELAKSEEYVILAPGAYANEEKLMLGAAHSNTTLYAYGAYVEGVAYADKNNNTRQIEINGVSNFAFKGLTFGYAQPSSGQLYVLKKLGNNKIRVVTGAGCLNDFSGIDGSAFFSSSAREFGLQRAGTYYGLGEYFFISIEKNGDGTMTVALDPATYDILKKGDVMTCRFNNQSNMVQTEKSSGVSYVDVTQYGNARCFAFSEYKNKDAVTYDRLAVIRKSGAVIDEDTYLHYAMLQEEYGVDLEISYDELKDGTLRYRGSPAHVSSIDAIHNSSSVEGSRVISCLFDGMCDDATNQKSSHARLSEVFDNGDGTATIIYKGLLSQNTYNQKGAASNFTGCCVHFQKGERVYIYTYDGQLVCDTPALTDMTAWNSVTSNCEGVTPKQVARYKITVAADAINYKALEGYDLTDDSYLPDEKVLVDNLSYASYGFIFDNCLIQNGEKSGMRVKASGGTVQNCTFRNLAKTATAMVYEIYWGESGIAHSYTFKNNAVENIGYAKYNATPLDEDSLQYRYTAICIIGLGGSVVDEEHMLFKDILIENNVFSNRCLENYNVAIYARGAGNITIRNNDFGTSEEEDGLDKYAGVMYLHRVVNVELSGNTYSPYIPNVKDYVQGSLFANIFGEDVGDSIPDKLN